MKDVLDQASVFQTLHFGPYSGDVGHGEAWAMDEVQVDVVHTQLPWQGVSLNTARRRYI